MCSKILVVDDERPLVNLIRVYLEREGFEVKVTFDGRSALDLSRRWQPEVTVLDWMLPEMSGTNVLQELRTFSDAYVIMLTARTEEADKVAGFSMGADDYLTKPFSPSELVMRVHAMLRRPRSQQVLAAGITEHLVFGPLVIDRMRHEVLLDGSPCTLTVSEFRVLAALASHPGVVFSRSRLLETVNGPDYYNTEHLIDVHVGNIRKKLGWDGQGSGFIQTIRGVGYRFEAP